MLSHGETSFIKPNPIKLVASYDTALRFRPVCLYAVAKHLNLKYIVIFE